MAQHGRRLLVRMDTDRDQVNAVRPEGAAPEQPSGRQGETAPEAVEGERLDRVVRAAGIEPAGGDPPRRGALVGRQQCHGDAGRTAECWRPPGSCADHGTNGAVQSSGHVHAEFGGLECGCLGFETDQVGAARQGWRLGLGPLPEARRRRELRTTAPPQLRPIAYATWGNTPVSFSVAGTNEARTGPLAPRDRERCSSANAARLVIRPTVRVGTSALRR